MYPSYRVCCYTLFPDMLTFRKKKIMNSPICDNCVSICDYVNQAKNNLAKFV